MPGTERIVPVDASNLADAAFVHAESWKDSHRSFCKPDFVALHTPQRQREYILRKMRDGSKFYLMIDESPVGVVSVNGNLIEDLYVLPEMQRKGYGTMLLRFAASQCDGTPTLWILENNTGAERLYCRIGFCRTGNVHAEKGALNEIEFAWIR